MTIAGAEHEQMQQHDFESFVAIEGLRLRRAFVARDGTEIGIELHADAMARAWRDWDRIKEMDNPAGYLWKSAQTDRRRYRRWTRPGPYPDRGLVDRSDPARGALFLSLGALSDAERVAVVMVHAHGASYQEVAEILDVPTTTVTNHVHRGLARLRHSIKEK